jgi:haloacetate dehalogenase
MYDGELTGDLILAENPGVRAGGWFFPFFGVPDIPGLLIAGNERELLSYFYRAWPYNPDVLSPDQIDVDVREYERPGGVQGFYSDYRTGP